MQKTSPRIYFISGHTDLVDEEFVQNYRAPVEAAIAEGAHFVLADEPGTDTIAHRYLAARDYPHVTVYHVHDQPRTQTLVDVAGFRTKGGFATEAARDEALTADSDADIAIVKVVAPVASKVRSGSWPSRNGGGGGGGSTSTRSPSSCSRVESVIQRRLLKMRMQEK